MKLTLMSLEVLVVLLACCSQAYGINRPIAFGDEIDISEVPYFASLKIRRGTKPYRCGGSILNTRSIITAAHCCFNFTSIRIRMGSSFYNTGGTVRNATKVIIHPNYVNNRTLDYDFCILRMRPVRYTSLVNHVNLPEIGEDLNDGDMFRVAGFGRTENGTTSNHLRGTFLPKFNRDLCKRLYVGLITNRMLCIGYATLSPRTGKGDSGGGSVAVNGTKLYGIVSFSKGEKMGPRVNARVNSVRNWIIDNWTD